MNLVFSEIETAITNAELNKHNSYEFYKLGQIKNNFNV
jgi:hypothetical protein